MSSVGFGGVWVGELKLGVLTRRRSSWLALGGFLCEFYLLKDIGLISWISCVDFGKHGE